MIWESPADANIGRDPERTTMTEEAGGDRKIAQPHAATMATKPVDSSNRHAVRKRLMADKILILANASGSAACGRTSTDRRRV